MSDNVSVGYQRGCVDSRCEDETYILDIFSYVQQPEGYGESESLKQLFLYIAKAGGKERSTFIQVPPELRLFKRFLINVHGQRFCLLKGPSKGTSIKCILVCFYPKNNNSIIYCKMQWNCQVVSLWESKFHLSTFICRPI